jgi:drug/metabolite transporter (DMT)-like permease
MIKYISMVFAGACSFGILSTFVKLAYREGYSAAEITFSQAFISMIILWLLVLFRGRTDQLSPSPFKIWKIWTSLLLTGAAIGLTTFVYYISVRYIPASLAVVILMQFTWMGALLEWLFYKKNPGRAQLIIMALIIGSTVLASGLANNHTGVIPLQGVLYALASALLYAIFIVANSRVKNQVSFLRKSAIIMTGYTLGVFIVNARALLTNNHFDYGLLKWILFFGMFGTMIPQLLFAKGIPQVGAGISAIIMTVELPVAVITAHALLNEPISAVQWLGISLMLIAMGLMNLRNMGLRKR